jgi:dTMP kinase
MRKNKNYLKKGIFVMVDGVDGSGKGVIIDTMASWAKKNNLKIFDLKKYWENNFDFPSEKDLEEYDCIVSIEPTFSMVGRAIREEIIRDNGRDYSAKAIAQAFSLDRDILYRKIVIPAIKQGKIIFQERGVPTSIIYQPLQKNSITIEEVVELPGNKLALEYRPDLLIISLTSPKEAIKRLEKREKKDEAIFEKLEFLRKTAKGYNSEWFKKIFEEKGASIHYLKTNKDVYDTMKKTLNIWKQFIKKYAH